MENTDLATIPITQIQKYDDSAFDSVSKEIKYLCRMQLCGGNSQLFKQGKIKLGNYAYIIRADSFIDLGPSVDILPLCWRPKALDMNGASPISVYDQNSQAFKDIASRSSQSNSMCSYGPDFLVWIPSIKKFASLMFGSDTARGEAPKLRERLGKPTTMTWRSVGPNKKKQVWEAMVINPCSTPFDMPTVEEAQAEADKFNAEALAKAPEPADQDNRTR